MFSLRGWATLGADEEDSSGDSESTMSSAGYDEMQLVMTDPQQSVATQREHPQRDNGAGSAGYDEMTSAGYDDRSVSIRALIDKELAAVEQVLAVSGELVRRLEVETGDQLKNAAAAVRSARSAGQAPAYHAAPGPAPRAVPREATDSMAANGRGDRALEYVDISGAPPPGTHDPATGESTDKQGKKGKVAKPTASKRGGIFGEQDDIKQNVRRALESGDSIEDEYKKKGCAQKLARSEIFKNFTFLMIFFSSVWIGVAIDLSKKDCMKALIETVDNCICAYFTFEIGVRLLAMKKWCDAFTHCEFNFDFALVILMLSDVVTTLVVGFFDPHAAKSGSKETGAMGSARILRLLRLFRLARLGRLVRACPDVVLLVRGMMMALRAVVSTIALLIVIIFIYSVFFVQLLSGSDETKDCFDTVLMGMNCLMLDGILDGGQAGLAMKLLSIHWFYYFCIMVFFALTSFTVMNMLIGVVCEIVTSVAHAETEVRSLMSLRDNVREAMSKLDDDNSGTITWEEFNDLFQNQAGIRLLHDAGVDVFALLECREFIFSKREELTFTELADEIMVFRSDNTCTVKDIVDMRLFLIYEFAKLERHLIKTIMSRERAV